MYLIDTDIDLSRTPRNFHTRNQRPSRIIEAFRRSGKPIMEVVFTRYEYKNSLSCRSTFANALSRMNIRQIRVVTRNGKVYLVNDFVTASDTDGRNAKDERGDDRENKPSAAPV